MYIPAHVAVGHLDSIIRTLRAGGGIVPELFIYMHAAKIRYFFFPMGGFPTFCVIATDNNN